MSKPNMNSFLGNNHLFILPLAMAPEFSRCLVAIQPKLHPVLEETYCHKLLTYLGNDLQINFSDVGKIMSVSLNCFSAFAV